MSSPGPTPVRDARPDDAAAIARVHVDSWRTTYRGIVPDRYLDHLDVGRREAMWRGLLAEGRPIVVAEPTGAGIVGFAAGGASREGDPVHPAEIHAIYLLETWQGRGLGRRLLAALARRLVARGWGGARLWVLEDNPARRFYEALGGTWFGEKGIEIGGRDLVELAYGWADLAVLAAADGEVAGPADGAGGTDGAPRRPRRG